MNWRFFVGASILSIGLLIKIGVPLVPLVLGVGLAAVVTWKAQRS
jgi:hypothetical protein